MAELLARGLRARPNLLDSAVTSASPGGDPAGGMGEFEKGLRSNLAAQSASALNSEGLKAEAAGRPDLAAEKYRQADMFSAEAQTFAPRVRSIRDIGGVQDALDFASGGLPQAVTSMAPTLAGALVGRGIGGRIGGVAGGLVPAYNLEADEAMGALARDPQTRSRMTADQLVNLGRGKGAINSALEVAGPAYLLERALGKRVAGSGMKEALKTVGVGGLIEGPLTELPQEVIGQGVQSYARTGDATKEIDPWGLADATALGALGGHAAAVPAAGVQYARGAAADAASKGKELAQSGMDAVRGSAAAAIDLAPKDSEPVLSTLRGRAGSMMDQAKVNWLAGTDSTIPDEIASNPEAVMQHLADQDNQRKSTVAEYLNSVATNEEAHPDRRAQAADMLSRLDDPETFRAAANMVAGAEKVKGYATRVNDLLADAKDFGAGFVAGNKKANAQRPEGFDKLPATEQLVTQTLLDGLSPEALEGGADQLVPLFRGMFTGKLPGTITSRVMRDFIGTYGDQAPDVASKIAPYIRRDAEDRGMDPAATVSAFQKFMADNEARMDTRREAISAALTNDARLRIQTELGRPMNEGDLSVVSDLMTRLTEGSLSKAMAPKVEAELKSYLGDRYKQTMNVFRALHDAEAQNEAVLAHAGDDIEDRAATHSFETMMEGVNRQWSLAKKADESGVAPLFDSREEAQKRWDENIAPKYPGFQGSVVTGDQYAAIGGIDPLALASQYDEKFKTAPSDYKDMAQHLKDAMALLRTKHVVQMDMVSNNDADVMTEKEVQRVFAKSALPVEQVEKPGSNENGRYYHFTDGGKTFRRDSKPTVADGYVFVHVGERARPVKVSALDYVMRGKQQKEAFGGTADEQVGADAQIRRALMGIARLGDAGVVNMEAGVFGYDVKGNKRWIIAPTKDGGKSKFPETLKMGQATFRELAAEREVARKKEEVEYWAPRIERAKNVLEENSRMDEALVKAAMRAVDRAEKRLSAAHSPFAKAQAARALSAAVDYLNDIPGHLAREWQKESESKRGADQFDSTDTDPMLSDEEVSRGEAEDEANFADVQRRTREQERSARKEKSDAAQPKQVAEEKSEAGKEEGAAEALTTKATNALDYMNNPPKDYDAKMPARIKAWAEKQLASSKDEDFRALLSVLIKKADEMTAGDAAVAKMEGRANEQKAGQEAATADEVAEAKEYIKTVLGRKIKTEFVDDLGGLSGEWEETDAANIIRIALNAGPGVRSVAHHEAMHEFMDRLMKRGTADVAQTLKNVAASPTVRKRLEVLLRNEPEALKQIRNDAEERVAYMYQFWAAGKLQVGPKAESLFERIKAFFRKITGMITESEKAEAILAAFHRGDFAKLSGFGKAVRAAANEDAVASAAYKQLAPLAKRAAELVYTSEGVLTSHDNKVLNELAAKFNTSTTSTSRDQGYLNAKAQEMNRWLNRFNAAIEGLEREELDAVRDALRAEKMPSTQHLRAPAREIRAILDEFHDYVTAAGVPLKHLRNYFPQVWDTNEIMSRNGEFKDLLLKHHEDVLSQIAERGNKERLDQLKVKIRTAAPDEVEALEAAREEMQQNPQTAEDVAETIVQRLLSGNGVDPLTEDENRVGYTPLMGALNKRTLNFIDKEAFADFFEKDTVRIMSNYLSQGVHRAEYARRFNNDGSGITNMLTAAFDEEVKKNEAAGDDAVVAMQKATATIESAKRAVMAMEGTLGHDITPVMRRFSSYMMVYQNMRILPLALFSSLIDPMGLAVRGGTLNDSLNGLRRGVKEIMNQIKGEYSSDEITKLAETIGTVDNAAFMDALGETYSSIYMTGWAKKLNDKIFHWNGMESWNRGMRIAATQAAIEFIKRNVENPGPHSERWLAELGLKLADVVIKDGKLEVLEGPNLNAIQAHRTQAAIQRWVDSAVLRPNAAQRPPWASDPHYALLFHMKQFTYSFQKTILARVTSEWREGNLMPAVALAWYVPMMIAADMVKAVLQGMGDEPEYMKGWTVQDYVSHGVQRAGLLGIGQFGFDAYNMGAESILGPTAEQAVDALRDPIDKTAIDALPGNPIYKNALK